MSKKNKKPLTFQEQVEHEQKYIAFLKRALDSENYKSFASPEEYIKTKSKYDKAKFRLKTLLERQNQK
jgi:hypothetical protein